MTDFSKYTYEDWLNSATRADGCPLNATTIYEAGCQPFPAIDFYETIFGHNLEPHRKPEDYQTGEYAAIALELSPIPPSYLQKNSLLFPKSKPERKLYGHRVTVTEGNQELYNLINSSTNDIYIAPISYAGLRRTNANARFMFALCVEIDDIEQNAGISELLYTFRRDGGHPVPPASFLVCSGNGVHVYWVFDKPIPMYKNTFEELKEIKNYLVRELWDKQISRQWQNPQYQSICQPFRAVGSVCKDRNKRVMCFKCGEKISIHDFNKRLPEWVPKISGRYNSKMTLAEAKFEYPEWYEKRIVQGKPRQTYNRHDKIYYNFVDKVWKYAAAGHRYHCLEALCALAVQCQIPRNQVVYDCGWLGKELDRRTKDEQNPFTDYDIECALRTYDNADESAYYRRLDVIENKTGIPLTPNKRNGLPRKEHLKIARAARDVKSAMAGRKWTDGNGAPSKQHIVQIWQSQNPNGTKAQCIRETGLSKPTVYKWWKGV